MIKRMIDAKASELQQMTKDELIASLALSEGRVLVSEITASLPSVFKPSNCEVACAFGCDMLLLNMFDVNSPYIEGIGKGDEVIRLLKKYTGRKVGINLEPTDFDGNTDWKMAEGRKATVENAKKAKELGIDFITITGNPNNRVENKNILKAIHDISTNVKELMIIAGKMHASGMMEEAGNNILNEETIDACASAGCDVILLPCPATVPGVDLSTAKKWIDRIHQNHKLAMTCIGTSQEGADIETIRELALLAKQAGADIHHIGDAGYTGVAICENIMAYSIAIKGKRHTYHRMASSINR